MSDVVLVKRPQVAGLPRKTPVAVMGSALVILGLGVFLPCMDRQRRLCEQPACAGRGRPAHRAWRRGARADIGGG